MALSDSISKEQQLEIVEWVLRRILQGDRIVALGKDGTFHQELDLHSFSNLKEIASSFDKENISRKEFERLAAQPKTSVRDFLNKFVRDLETPK